MALYARGGPTGGEEPRRRRDRHAEAPTLHLPAEEIQMRAGLRAVNEAILCLREGVVRSAADADIGAILGLGFPAFRGGPLRYVDAVGPAEILRRMRDYEDRFERAGRPRARSSSTRAPASASTPTRGSLPAEAPTEDGERRRSTTAGCARALAAGAAGAAGGFAAGVAAGASAAVFSPMWNSTRRLFWPPRVRRVVVDGALGTEALAVEALRVDLVEHEPPSPMPRAAG